MTDFSASRFPDLAPQVPMPPSGLALTYALIPLPLGEIIILLLAWSLLVPG